MQAIVSQYNLLPDESKITAMGDAVNWDQATIPVIDMKDAEFVRKVSEALQNIGFFALVNTGMDHDVLEASYRASEEFFKAPMHLKDQICKPELNGQRGFVHSEVAQGEKAKDIKEFIHIGNKDNLWPEWMNLETPMMNLMKELDKISVVLQRALATAIGEHEEFFLEQTKDGENLLRPLYYPKNESAESIGAAPHTDIDDFTLLPMSTEEGLQVLHDKKWVSVKVPPNAVIVNGGDKLQNLTNGFFKSAWHRVKMAPDKERRSIVYFVHPKWDDSRSPTAKCIERTGGVQRYPVATSGELLTSRLRELKLASQSLLEFEKASGIMDRIAELVKSGNAARPVQRTYILWSREQQEAQNY